MKFEELTEYKPLKVPHNFKNLIDYENEVFKVISRAPNSKTETMWNCLCKKCGEYCVKPKQRIDRDKSCGCLKKSLISQARIKNLVGNTFGMLTVLSDTGERNKSKNVIWLCQCECGNLTKVDSNNLTSNHTTSCGCIHHSIGVKNIEKILRANNIEFIEEYGFRDLYGKSPNHLYYYDFAIINDNNEIIRMIEYDGIQHYKETWGAWKTDLSLEQQQKRDQEKNQYALSHNIPLVRIPYWERDNITLDMIMGDQYLICE